MAINPPSPMPSESSGTSLPIRLLISVLVTVGVVWLMAAYLDQYFQLTGSPAAFVIVGALLTLMNLFVRPVLAIVTLPLKLFATILAIIVVNGAFVWLTVKITDMMEPALVTLRIFGGPFGWIVVAVVFGLTHWITHRILGSQARD